MQTYLVVCGIVLHAIVLLIIIAGIISEIRARRKRARWNAQYNQDLKNAEIAWQVWAKRLDELQQEQKRKGDNTLPSSTDWRVLDHIRKDWFYFASCDQHVYLSDLAKRNGWVRK